MDQTVAVSIFFLAGAVLAGIAVLALSKAAGSQKGRERLEDVVRAEISRLKSDLNGALLAERAERGDALKNLGDSLFNQVSGMASLTGGNLETMIGQISAFSRETRAELENTRRQVESTLTSMREESQARLDAINTLVSEKLHDTLEKRLGASFHIVNEQLERVHHGLGEMKILAGSVTALERTLSNVKTRGTWGEFSLGAILEQTMAPGLYEKNAATRPMSQNRVDYAIRLPGAGGENGTPVWLPIDAKFPLEDIQRLEDAREKGDAQAAAAALKSIEARIRAEAKSIREKYVEPPYTTDFAIMFLPTEGLYAEVVRRPGLLDYLQRESRVVVAGPVTLSALLNSLQMGFKTLAIERRAGEVWDVVESLRTEFAKFGDIMVRARKKLEEAGATMDEMETRTRQINRKLNRAQLTQDSENPGAAEDGKEPLC
jgi:DNA recombination protein RmuC